MGVSTGLVTKVVQRVLALPAEVSAELMPELEKAAGGIAKVGARQVKDMILSLPIFVLFVRELLRRRDEFDAQKQLFVIGAAAAFSTLGLIMLGTVLSSLPVKLLLLFSNPALAIFLLTSGGLFVAAVIVLLAWLVIYALNFVMEDDPVFQEVRERFLTPKAKKVLRNVEKAVRKSGADTEKMRDLVGEAIKQRGKKSDAKKLDKGLRTVDRGLGQNSAKRKTGPARKGVGRPVVVAKRKAARQTPKRATA